MAIRPLLLVALVALLLLPTFPAAAAESRISGYRSIFQPCYDRSGALRLAIRRYERGGTPHVLLVNPRTFETAVAPLASLKAFQAPVGQAELRATPFDLALTRHTSPPCRLQNHGAVRADLPVDGVFLTVDMCPSKRPFEKEFFAAVAGLSRQSGRPTPVALAMTGNWLENHRDELAWLVQQIREGRLAVTWVNHSDSHPYDPKAPLTRNFLLSPGIDLEREVLATEQLLLESGLTPSPFFRFPGLVADAKALEQLRQLSLIPLGSDAWLAKGEEPRNGSFILVHGNGNEPAGIARALPLLRDRGLRLLPLTAAFAPATAAAAGAGGE
ncbi:MAG: polysaccharide deacetylase [Geobacteraceae bacterium]|nr:polysaccharide deacetylase [Geobacteraceae bacterium]